MNADKIYIELVKNILEFGEQRLDRTGTGTLSLFGAKLEFDLTNNKVPLLTTKFVSPRLPVEEMLWFLRGNTNINELNKKNIHIWDKFANKQGDCGQIYGYQWKNWGNQIENLIHSLKNNPYSRRHLVSAWNTAELPDESISPKDNVGLGKMSLAPCHFAFQCYVTSNKELDLLLHIRSSDVFLGLPFNIFQYAVLNRMLAEVCDLSSRRLIITLGDYHIYLNHIEQIRLQLTKEPMDEPAMEIINPKSNIFDYVWGDFKVNYSSHERIYGEMSV